LVFNANREFNCEAWLAQTCEGVAEAVDVVKRFLYIVADALFTQPVVVLVPVTVYTVVARLPAADATTVAPETVFNPPEGLQENVLAPLAVIKMLDGKPPHMEPPGGVMVSTGSGLTWTTTGALAVATPQKSVTVTM
jgi:hypothetical protein